MVDTTFGSGSVFTATVRLTVLPGSADLLEKRFGADVSAVRTFGAAVGS
jgi:hypothetical protein